MTLAARRAQVRRDFVPVGRRPSVRLGKPIFHTHPLNAAARRKELKEAKGLRQAQPTAADTEVFAEPLNYRVFRSDGHRVPDLTQNPADGVLPGEPVTAFTDLYNDGGLPPSGDEIHQVRVTWELTDCRNNHYTFDGGVFETHSVWSSIPTTVSATFTFPGDGCTTSPIFGFFTNSELAVQAIVIDTDPGGSGVDFVEPYVVPPIPGEETYGCRWSNNSSARDRDQGCAGDPVDTATGAYAESFTDAQQGGPGFPLALTRNYSSDDPTSGPLGAGWTMPWLAGLSVQSNGDVVFRAEDDRTYRYVKKTDGSFTAPPLSRSVLARTGSGFMLTAPDDHHRLAFDTNGRLTGMTDSTGRGVALAYDGSVLGKVTDAAGRTATLSYDSGLLSAVAFSDGHAVRFGYTSGRLTSVTERDGAVTRYGYDASGRLESITDADGHRLVHNTYDSSGRVTVQTDATGATTRLAYNGAETDVTDPNGGVWTHVYVGNALFASYDPYGNKTSFYYDDHWRPTSMTDPLGNTTTYGYDSAGNLSTRTAPAPQSTTEHWTYNAAGDLASYTSPRQKTTSFTYNDDHQLTSTTTAKGEKTTFGYDQGRLTTQIDPRGNVSGADPADFTWSYGYDDAGLLATVTDPLGHSDTFSYDADGAVAALTDPAGHKTSYTRDAAGRITAVTDPAGATTSYMYDAAGNLTQRKDANGHVTGYGRDDQGHLVAITDPLGHAQTFGYDGAGNLTTSTDARGIVRTRTLDARGLPTKVAYSDATPAVTAGYDADGRLTALGDPGGQHTLGYDNLGRLQSVATAAGSFGYAYDADGNVTSRTYPDGDTATFGYDDDGDLASQTAGGATTQYGYDPAGHLVTAILPPGNGYTETRSYDAAGRLTKIAGAKSGTTLASWNLTLDPAGRPTKVDVTRAGTPATTRTYGYNADGRLTSECVFPATDSTCPGGSDQVDYTYDGVGNRTTSTSNGETTGYSYDAADQLTTTTTGGTKTTYGYDDDGNQTSAGGGRSYTYDGANRLTKAVVTTTAATTTRTYTYDSLGNRVSASTNGAIDRTTGYDINNPLPQPAYDADSAGHTTADYRYDPLGDPQSEHTPAGTFYDHHDWLGSITDLTNAAGVDQYRSTYSAYGAADRAPLVGNPPANPFAYAGAPTDQTTGLDHMRARDYDPATGRFTSRDPIELRPGQPYTSSYAYAADAPTYLTDPSGEDTFGLCVGVSWSWLSPIGHSRQVCPLVLGIDDRTGDISVGGTFTKGRQANYPLSLFGADANAVVQVSTARNVSQLGGPFVEAGGNMDVPGAGLTGDVFGGQSCGALGNIVVGGEGGLTTGSPGAQIGTTMTLTKTYFTFSPLQSLGTLLALTTAAPITFIHHLL
ncbi:MAG TPA: DUF6531 domain-containing protein [Streptosporangiaceae bacterium]